jgi:hypothetical protein
MVGSESNITELSFLASRDKAPCAVIKGRRQMAVKVDKFMWRFY